MGYGKIWDSTFTGSMMGAGPIVFAVWSWIIAHQVDGDIEINAKLLAVTIGCSEQEVRNALDYLMQPDAESRSSEEQGKRLLHINAFQYYVVNGSRYSAQKTNKERRDAARDRVRRFRERERGDNTISATSSRQKKEVNPDFAAFWDVYPIKKAKAAAEKAWAKTAGTPLATILCAIDRQRVGWPDPKFIPHPATWLNRRQWEDEPTSYGVCYFCDRPAVGTTHGVPYCCIARHMDQAKDFARNAK